MKKYKIGVIGIGMGSTLLAINKDKTSQIEVIGISDIDLDRAKKLATEHDLKYVFDDYKDLIKQDDIDIVAVFSPDHLHGEHCIASLKLGKHVICTKPMVTKEEDSKKIVEIVKEKKLKFLTGQTMRYEPQFTTIKKMYDDGDIGQIIMAEAHYVHDMREVFTLTPWRLHAPQDLMFGGVCHPVDVLRWFLGDVEEVFAYGNKGNLTPEYPIMSNFFLNLRFKNGVIARILGAYDIVHPPMPMMGVSIFGSKASAIGSFSDKLGGQVKMVFDKFDYKNEASIDYPAETEGAYGHGATVIRYLKHFEDCLNKDITPVPDAVEGAKSVAVCTAAWQSIQSGSPVKVNHVFLTRLF
jgi:predicted dehydrogenase